MSKQLTRGNEPTKSSSIGKAHIAKKITYNKMTELEKMEFDLKKEEQNETKLKEIIKNKGYSTKKITGYIKKMIGKYDPNIVYIENLVFKGKDLISVRINENIYEHNTYSINKIKKISNALSQYLNKKKVNGKMMTSLLYGDLGWKSGYLKTFGQETDLYDPNKLYNLEVPYDEPKKIKSFNIYIALGNRPEGGNDDKLNDCLYDCLKYFIFNIEDYFKSPAVLKQYLGLERASKIPLECLDKIEKKLKTFKINVRGEFIRSSTVSSNNEINLILNNEHYSVEKPNRIFTPFIKFNEKIPIMWDKKTFEVYDGTSKWLMDKKRRNDVIFNSSNNFILVPRLEQGRDENGNKIIISIEDEYNLFLEIAYELKQESKGLINLFKSGSLHDASLTLFDRLTKFITPEEILQDEAEWIKFSSFGAIIWCEPFEGKLYKYDFKSMYPHLMTSSTLKFPVKRGEFKNIGEFNNQYFEYGIYRAVIQTSDDENINKLFRFNKHNYYTSIDLTNAKKLGLNIELIKDDNPNFLYYSRDKLITFNEVFKQYVEILFPLKENKNLLARHQAKAILNILWGALCEVDKRKMFIQDKFKIEEDEEIIEIYPSSTDENSHIIKTTKLNHYYKTPFARLCPFLIGQGRKQMSDTLFEYKDHIHRIQTDGFLCDIPIHFKTDVKIGELKYEGYTEHGIIKNCINKVETN